MSKKIQVNTTGVSNDMADNGSAVCIAKASDGTIWIAYVDLNVLGGDLLVAYSPDGGSTWTEETAVSNAPRCDAARSLALLIDSNDVPILIFVDGIDGDIHYADRSGGAWNASELIIATSASVMTACIDSGDNIHIAWRSPSIDYLVGKTGAWGAKEDIEASIALGNITVNSSDEPIVCLDDHLRHRTGGNWAAADTFDDQAGLSNWGGKFVIDGSDNYFAVWEQGNDIYYRKKTNGGSWGTTLTVVSAGADDFSQPIVIADSDGNVYVVYQFTTVLRNLYQLNSKVPDINTSWVLSSICRKVSRFSQDSSIVSHLDFVYTKLVFFHFLPTPASSS